MPISTKKRSELSDRRARVAQLDQLGLSKTQIDSALGLTPGTTDNDIVRIARTREAIGLANDRRSRQGAYAHLFGHYARIMARVIIAEQSHAMGISPGFPKGTWDFPPGPMTEEEIFSIILDMLNINHLVVSLHAEANILMDVAQPPTREPDWCARLLHTLFGAPQPREILDEEMDRYLVGVARGSLPAPNSPDDVRCAMRAQIVARFRAEIRPDWPPREEVERIVMDILETLGERQRDIVLLSFRHQLPNTTIGDQLGISPERVWQIRNKALRGLRLPSRANELRPLLAPCDLSPRATVGRTSEVSATGETPPSSDIVDNLCRTVDDCELPYRVVFCLLDADIKYYWELCTHTESDLLHLRRFGRKSLNDVKFELEKLGLRLRMREDDPNILAARERCPRD